MRRRHRRTHRRLGWMGLGAILLLLCLLLAEGQLLPTMREISHLQCKALANRMIDEAMEASMEQLALGGEALLLATEEGYTANTMLVNRFCTELSRRITEEIAAPEAERIEIPLGAATNLAFLAQRGPKIRFTLLPMGSVKVDYETALEDAGINQIHYKIWIAIAMEVKIVNPLYQESLRLERKMMLADLLFSGQVPSHYFQMEDNGSIY